MLNKQNSSNTTILIMFERTNNDNFSGKRPTIANQYSKQKRNFCLDDGLKSLSKHKSLFDHCKLEHQFSCLNMYTFSVVPCDLSFYLCQFITNITQVVSWNSFVNFTIVYPAYNTWNICHISSVNYHVKSHKMYEDFYLNYPGFKKVNLMTL